MKENCRDARGTGFLEITLQDLRYGFRVLSKSRGYSLISLLTLAIGIGASVAMFSLVNTVLIKRLPYPNADRVVMPWRDGPIGNFFAGSNDFPWSPVEYDLFSRTQTIFQNLGAFKKDSFNLTGPASPELLEGVRATAGFFPALGVSPLIGRAFRTDEDKPGHEDVAVLSYHLWQGEFGGDAGIVGRVIELNGHVYTVIGVMPGEFSVSQSTRYSDQSRLTKRDAALGADGVAAESAGRERTWRGRRIEAGRDARATGAHLRGV